MAMNEGKHAAPRRGRTGRKARAAFVVVGVLAASLLAGATAAEADTVGVTLCRVTGCSIVMPNGVRWQ